LAPDASYPEIDLLADVTPDGGPVVTSSAQVSGGGADANLANNADANAATLSVPAEAVPALSWLAMWLLVVAMVAVAGWGRRHRRNGG
jgi:hypothetical protein